MKYFFSFIVLWALSFPLFAGEADSISTVYRDGRFQTYYRNTLKSSNKITSDVADYLVSDFHNSPGHLFEWALKGLGLKNKKNELIIIFKASHYDNKTGIAHGVFDIVVPGFITFHDVKVDAIVTKTSYTSGVNKVRANIIYSSLLLKNAVGSLYLIPRENNDFLVETNVEINFGWFFNLFITQKRYKSIVEWRIKKFAENIKDECERRTKFELK
jgi:hypothetical protein